MAQVASGVWLVIWVWLRRVWRLGEAEGVGIHCKCHLRKWIQVKAGRGQHWWDGGVVGRGGLGYLRV